MMEGAAQLLADGFAGSPLLGASPSHGNDGGRRPAPSRWIRRLPAPRGQPLPRAGSSIGLEALGAAAGAGVPRGRAGWGPSGGPATCAPSALLLSHPCTVARIFAPPGQPLVRTSAFTSHEPRASPVWCCAYERVGEICVQRVEKIDAERKTMATESVCTPACWIYHRGPTNLA
ncbi:unnamed protein product [Triticum turgidum subsp. durum]|uniref:Uncharacterized protein n=1 Tax=Triticum turgidum subsp. durum TaxID=4567 RepID=A0A9R1AJ82_TRITD|nr:unnamed protein product [Triticum turgidum subsp. durum]